VGSQAPFGALGEDLSPLPLSLIFTVATDDYVDLTWLALNLILQTLNPHTGPSTLDPKP